MLTTVCRVVYKIRSNFCFDKSFLLNFDRSPKRQAKKKKEKKKKKKSEMK